MCIYIYTLHVYLQSINVKKAEPIRGTILFVATHMFSIKKILKSININRIIGKFLRFTITKKRKGGLKIAQHMQLLTQIRNIRKTILPTQLPSTFLKTCVYTQSISAMKHTHVALAPSFPASPSTYPSWQSCQESWAGNSSDTGSLLTPSC